MIQEKQPTEFGTYRVEGGAYRVELTPEEAKALAPLLPRNYTFHLDHRKKEKPHAKKKTEEAPLPAESPIKTEIVQVMQPPPKKSPPRPELVLEAVKPCLKILEQLKQHKCGWPFLQPVDVEGLGIPEYSDIIKQPMDLSKIEDTLFSGGYLLPVQFHQDVLKIFSNSYIFNEAYEDFIKITHELERYYYRISPEIRPPPEKTAPKQQPAPARQQKKKKKPSATSRETGDSLPVTTEEKRELAFHLHRLAKEHIKGVRNIVFEGGSSELNQFDLEKLSQKKLRELQKYVRHRLAEMETNIRSTLQEKSEHQNLDELESEITEEFIDEPLEGLNEVG